ncbi:nitroreductase [Campylobacter ureolyticus RIGS 9880]|uniref:Nitroreductase n=1 Tax=Campylobacter ureolyticus RIGS 9880 TaxID=1032069 RepID=A0AAU8U5R3_9BACT|nr:nitroreductase family protein [Campylobacter ureolyticus]AKT91336.1 nitroreductase [Campylobacter ureolyticus RIGS 9880]
MEYIENIMQNRHSCRNFKDEKIKDGVINEILDLTRLTPSSLALEPWKFIVISKDNDIKKMGEICLNQPQVSNCSHIVVITARTDLQSKDEYLKHIIYSKNKGEDKAIKFLKMVSSKTDLMTENELYNYASLQCYMALANLVNIAYSKRVKSCIIGGFDKEKLTKFLNLPNELRPCIVVALGLSDEKSTPKIRQSLDEVVIWR